jgi:hypothetical protein
MYSLIHNHQVSKLPALIMLVLALGFIMPVAAQAQNIPPVGKPALVGIWCPSCKGYIPCPSGKRPSKCPHCPYSFVQGTKPSPAPVRPLKPLPGPGNKQPQPVPGQTDDRLYYDGIVTPGGLKTRHFEADGLPARAEKWGKEMRQVDEESQKKKDALARSLDNDKKNLLEKDGSAIALPQLKNPFADDPNVVDLREPTKPTPSIPPMGDEKPSGSPIYEGDVNPLVALSDEQLEKKREALGKAISEIAKLQAAVTSGYTDLESNAQAGMALAEKALVDAGATATFGISGEIALKKAVETAAGSADLINLGDTIEKQSSDPSSVTDGDAISQALTIGSGLMKSNIGKVPGLVQNGIDTLFVLGTAGKLTLDSYQQKDLQEQHNANLLRLTLAQMQVIEEQNRRKRREASK